jgi:hypothetical protein
MNVVDDCVNLIKSMLNMKIQHFTIFQITALIFIQGTQFTDFISIRGTQFTDFIFI